MVYYPSLGLIELILRHFVLRHFIFGVCREHMW